MGQFTVHRNRDPKTRRAIPYLLDVQTELLSSLATRVVVPLVAAAQLRAAERLNPVFQIEGQTVIMSTAELAGIPVSALGPVVTVIEDRRSEIIAALDFLFTGI